MVGKYAIMIKFMACLCFYKKCIPLTLLLDNFLITGCHSLAGLTNNHTISKMSIVQFYQKQLKGVHTLSTAILDEDFAEGLDLVVKSFDALDLGGVFRTFFGVDVVLAALEPDLIMKK